MRKSDEFHIFYEQNRLWEGTSWFGVPAWKLPFDAWIIQELIWKIKPDLIIETGSGKGGSALFYASLLHCIGGANKRVISVDIESIDQSQFMEITPSILSKITFFNGGSTESATIDFIEKYVRLSAKVMVLLDSWHSEDHVLDELTLYSPFVTQDSYIIVEDSHVGGNPVPWEYGKGPMGAIKKFLEKTDKFISDQECEKLILTFNPLGYLKRVK